MEGWRYWEGRKVFIILKNNRQYSGLVLEVESTLKSPLVWITIRDKFDNRISFSIEEIKVIQEERKEDGRN